MNSRFIERHYPFIVSICISLGVLIAKINLHDIKNLKEILSSVVNLSSILVGFLAAMISILIAIAGQRVMKRIKDNNASDLLKSYFFGSVSSGFIVVIYSTFLNIWVDLDNEASRWLLISWSLIVSFFILSSFRIIYIMMLILKAVLIEYDTKDDESKTVIPDGKKAFHDRKRKND